MINKHTIIFFECNAMKNAEKKLKNFKNIKIKYKFRVFGVCYQDHLSGASLLIALLSP